MNGADVTAARLPWDAADPYPFYEARRREGDVVWDDVAQGWLVLGYDAARQVLGGTGWTSDPLANPVARAQSFIKASDGTPSPSGHRAYGANAGCARGEVIAAQRPPVADITSGRVVRLAAVSSSSQAPR